MTSRKNGMQGRLNGNPIFEGGNVMRSKAKCMWCFIAVLALALPAAAANTLPDGAGPFTNDANTVALYHFDTATGSLVDSSSNGHTLTVNGDATHGTGRFDEGYSFDGNGDYLSTPNTADLGQLHWGPCSFEASVKLNNFDADGHVLFMGWGDRITVTTSHHVMFRIEGSPGFIISDDPLSADTWYHLAMTYNGTLTSDGTMRAFVNGVEQSTTHTFTASNYYIGNALHIGGEDPGHAGYIDGVIDEVRLSNVDRSIPEPATVTLLGVGACLSLLRRRRR